MDSTGVVTVRWPLALISIRKRCNPAHLQKLPPRVAPARRAGV